MPKKTVRKKQSIYHPKELPPCKGPKLQAFPKHRFPIEWLGRIDGGDENIEGLSDSGRQGYVFKVRIDSQLYALKVVKQFKFFNPDDSRYYWDDLVEGPAGRRLVELHTDPFYAECRAYGRIHQEKQRGTLTREVAIPCFGFIYLGDEHRPMLEQSGVDLEEDCLDDELSQPEDHPQHPRPIRAIVKKLASSDSGLNNKGSVGRMLKSIKELNRLQIYNKDIRKDNFRDEQLVDFGSSWTEPHCFMGDSNILNATDTRIGDFVMFDEMVDMEGIFAQWRAMPNWPYKKKLRSHAKGSNN